MIEVILHQGKILREMLACVALWWLCSKRKETAAGSHTNTFLVTKFILVRGALDLQTVTGRLSTRRDNSLLDGMPFLPPFLHENEQHI